MKAILAALVVAVLLGLLGWFTLYKDGDRAGVDANPDVVASDLEAVGEAGAKAAGAIGEGAKKVAEEADKVDIDVSVDRD